MPVRLALLTAKGENLSTIRKKKIAKPILSDKTIYRNKTMIILILSVKDSIVFAGLGEKQVTSPFKDRIPLNSGLNKP